MSSKRGNTFVKLNSKRHPLRVACIFALLASILYIVVFYLYIISSKPQALLINDSNGLQNLIYIIAFFIAFVSSFVIGIFLILLFANKYSYNRLTTSITYAIILIPFLILSTIIVGSIAPKKDWNQYLDSESQDYSRQLIKDNNLENYSTQKITCTQDTKNTTPEKFGFICTGYFPAEGAYTGVLLIQQFANNQPVAGTNYSNQWTIDGHPDTTGAVFPSSLQTTKGDHTISIYFQKDKDFDHSLPIQPGDKVYYQLTKLDVKLDLEKTKVSELKVLELKEPIIVNIP